jgi:hypothetical protein
MLFDVPGHKNGTRKNQAGTKQEPSTTRTIELLFLLLRVWWECEENIHVTQGILVISLLSDA